MAPTALSSATVVVRSDGIMDAEVDQEIVALSIEKGVCYGLDPIGARIWRLLSNPICIADICKVLVSEYRVDAETCEREVIELLEEFRTEGMIGVPGNAVPEAAAKGGN
jgi:hypothetical protein